MHDIGVKREACGSTKLLLVLCFEETGENDRWDSCGDNKAEVETTVVKRQQLNELTPLVSAHVKRRTQSAARSQMSFPPCFSPVIEPFVSPGVTHQHSPSKLIPAVRADDLEPSPGRHAEMSCGRKR